MEYHNIKAERPSTNTCDNLYVPYVPTFTYLNHVNALRSRNPCLMNLYQFLSDPRTRRSNEVEDNCRICAMDFRVGNDEPLVRKDLKFKNLDAEIRAEPRETLEGYKALQGRILVIEDLSSEIVELLGTELDIDPLFFALHLHTVRRTSSRHQTPDEATLPSRFHCRDFMNVSYHQAVISDTAVPFKGRFLRTMTVDRKLVFIRSTQIGLAQQCVSMIRIKNRHMPWLALILVDRPIGHTYLTDDADKRQVTLRLRSFLDTYEDFLEPPPFSSRRVQELDSPALAQGMFEDLPSYWSRERPDCFDPWNPSIESLAYYPLRIVAAQWIKYVAVMQYCLKQYEYNHDKLPSLGLDKFDKDLQELQSWRRRVMVSQGKIKSVVRFLAPRSRERECEDLDLLREDFEYVNGNIETVGRRLESMLPVVMSFVQITDAKRSFAETANITRLTVLALIFVPLTFISSLFSMNTQLSNLRPTLGIYFTIAVPLTIFVVIIANPPANLRGLARRAVQWNSEARKNLIFTQRAKARTDSEWPPKESTTMTF